MATPIKCKQTKTDNSVDLTFQSQVTEDSIRTCSNYEQQLFHDFQLTHTISTLNDVLTLGLGLSGNGPCLGIRNESSGEYEWISYSKVIEKVINIGFGLRNLAISCGCRYRIGIYSCKHFDDCLIVEYGCYSSGLIVVPLDVNLTPKDCASLLNEMNIGIVVVDTPDRVSALVSQANYSPNLKYIVIIETILESFRSKATGFGITVKTLNELADLGEDDPIEPEEKIKPYDTALVIHTNGTSGQSKGVLLSHYNVLNNAIGLTIRLNNHKPSKCDTLFCYLPITQMYQRCFQVAIFMAGGRLGFSERGMTKSWKDMESLKPTLLVTIPRLIKKLHDKLFLKIRGNKVMEWLVSQAVAPIGGCAGRRSINPWQALVLSKIRGSLGGNLRLVIIAKSLLPRYLINFIRSSLGAKVCLSYGLKEASGPVTMSFPNDESTEHVGIPLPNVSIQLRPITDLDCQPWSEIWIKGSSLSQGYWCSSNKILDHKSADRWFATGDVGFWRSNGTLELIDRQVDIVRLQQGGLIAPRRIEAIYGQSQFIDHIYLHSEPKKSLVGIVRPEKKFLCVWARENNLKGTYYDLCKEQRVHEEIIADLRSFGRRYGLEPYEQIKIISLVSDEFNPKNGLINSMDFLNRTACQLAFAKLIQGMHSHECY